MNEQKLRIKMGDVREYSLQSGDSDVCNAWIKIFKGELCTLRVHLHQELSGHRNSNRYVGLELVNKNLKSFRYLFKNDQNIHYVLLALNKLLRWFLQIATAEDNGTLDRIKPTDLRLFGLKLTSSFDDISDFKKNIMKSLWIITYYLSPHWPTEKKLQGDSIDSDFSRKLGLEKRPVIAKDSILSECCLKMEKSINRSLKDYKKNRLVIEKIIEGIDKKQIKCEINLKSIEKEALKRNIGLRETTRIISQLERENKIKFHNEEWFIVKK